MDVIPNRDPLLTHVNHVTAGQYQAFLPNDGAFVSLAQDLGYAGEDEGEALQTILDASAAADPDNPLQLVTDILTYHVSPGAQDAEAVLASETLATVTGATIGVEGTTLVDQDADTAAPTLIDPDIAASNGIAHAIDEVLLPVDIPEVDDVRPTDEEVVVDADDGGFGGRVVGFAKRAGACDPTGIDQTGQRMHHRGFERFRRSAGGQDTW